MSIGVGGFAELTAQDEKTLLYRYGAYNLNIQESRNADRVCDGIILIARDALVESEIHRKLTRRPSSRKVIVEKHIYIEPPWAELFQSGKISVSNCNNCWLTVEYGIDVTARELIEKIFRAYQIEGKIPEKLAFDK